MALIEREAAQRRFENYRRDCEEAGDTVAAQIFADCITELEDAPTIDPIRAAGGCRCGECRHGRKSADALEFDGVTPLCECGYMTLPHRWYEHCSWGEPREARTMAECIYKTSDGYCVKHSDGIELWEPCIRMDGPCDDETLPEPPKEDSD